MSTLEGADGTHACASGMAASHLALLAAGAGRDALILCASDVYGSVFTMVKDTSAPFLLYSFVVLYGLGHGSLPPISAAKSGDIFFGRSLGKILGITSAGFGLGGALGAYGAGYLYDITQSYVIPFMLSLLALVVGALGIWRAAPPALNKPTIAGKT